jgi:hypothetical protein
MAMSERNGSATKELDETKGWRPAPTRGTDRLAEPPRGRPQRLSRRRRWLHDNGLSIAAFALFLATLGGMTLAGRRAYNEQQRQHGEPTVSLGAYVRTGHFGEALFENWESGFLQIAAFVVLTALLYQTGSPESKDPEKHEAVDEDPRHAPSGRDVPWPVRRGGVALKVYEHSLGIALVLLFVLSFVGHLVGGRPAYSAEQVAHGGPPASTLDYLTSSTFWFESFQNWQSEFFSVGVLFVLTICLRERGSSQSKPVAASNGETGE